MKTHLCISRFFAILFLLIANISLAQLGHIDSLKILPTVPVDYDSIKVQSYSTFSSGGCEIYKSRITYSEHNIIIEAYHRVGMLTVICHSNDMINIGKLNVGNYTIIYLLRDASSETIFDMKTKEFYVSSLPHVSDLRKPKIATRIYPNPFNSFTTISVDEKLVNPSLEIKIYNMLGEEVKVITNITSNEIKVDGSSLTNGLYFFNIINEGKTIDTEKVIIE